jgi:ubiquinone/menaquinone biosynthesis C-methylase UbiE
MSHETFDGDIGDKFENYANTLKGWIRYRQVQHQLGQALEGLTELNIADIGGGTGIDTVWLAHQGHAVTMIDSSHDQIKKAEQRVAELPGKASSHITLIHGTIDDLLSTGVDHSFDVVLSHCVAMYQPDPKPFIGKLGLLTKKEGMISILEKGKLGTEVELSARTRHADLERLETTGMYRNELNIQDVHSFLPEELQSYLTHDANAHVIDWFGVGATSNLDPRSALAIPEERREAMLRNQIQIGNRPDARGLGPLLHFIAEV